MVRKHRHEWLWWERVIRYKDLKGPEEGYERICIDKKCKAVQRVRELKPAGRLWVLFDTKEGK